MPSNSFERFYYEKVALGEGCGCTEQIIVIRDLDRRSEETPHRRQGGRLARFRRLFRRLGRGLQPSTSEKILPWADIRMIPIERSLDS